MKSMMTRMAKEETSIVPAVATIGFFDGVHRGHLCLIKQLQEEATQRGLRSLLVTFDRHPRTVVSPENVPTLLTTLEEKELLLKQTGVDDIEILPFTLELSRLSAKDFMNQVLYQKLNVRVLVLGYDHAFGHREGGNIDSTGKRKENMLCEYARWGEEIGIEVVRAHELEGTTVSSSKCRKLLEAGEVEKAAKMLGRRYSLNGKVVKGFHVGHELGFPTANLKPSAEKLIPANGAYAVCVILENGKHLGGMLNIGNRPTIGNGETVSIEVNLLDYEGDLYGQRMTIEFVSRLRDEIRFKSREDLTRQLEKDRKIARECCKDCLK